MQQIIEKKYSKTNVNQSESVNNTQRELVDQTPTSRKFNPFAMQSTEAFKSHSNSNENIDTPVDNEHDKNIDMDLD